MLIKKGEIYRNIDEKRLPEYKAKGYEPLDADSPAGKSEKSLDKMNTAELTQKAADLGVDISGAGTNKLRAELIQEYLAKQQEA
jgi:hypothetical protein